MGITYHHNCGLYVIDVFDSFEYCISLEIPVFDSYVGLERLHVLDKFFTCILALESMGYEIWLKENVSLKIYGLMW